MKNSGEQQDKDSQGAAKVSGMVKNKQTTMTEKGKQGGK